MRAMVQLPSYVERVLAGGRDLALVLLPLLNDLRAVRGSPLLSEGTLLPLNLKSDQQAAPSHPRPANRRSPSRNGRAVCAPASSSAWSAGSAANVPNRISRSSKPSRTSSNRWPRASRCSSSGGWSAPSSRPCATAASIPAFRSSACWAWPIAKSCSSTTQGEGRYSQSSARRVAEQPAVLHRARHQQWARSPRCAPRSG